MRKLLPLILLLGMAFVHTGCSSDEKPAESETAQAIAEDDLDSGDKSAAVNDKAGDKAGGDDAALDSGGGDLADSGGGDKLDDTAALDKGDGLDAGGDLADAGKGDKLDNLDSLDGADLADIDKDLPPDMGGDKQAKNDAPPADAGATPPPGDAGAPTADAGATPPPADGGATPPADGGFGGGAPVADAGTPPPAPKAPAAPLQKIKDAPFDKGGTIMNTVYLARPGDKWKSVSEKIYHSNRVKDLKKWNSGISSRELKSGDKVYYNSPNRPDDQNMMQTFYEDNGIPAQSYISKAGDNLKEVAAALLGSKDTWKELWATNLSVESKSKLSEGTELRYWSSSEGGSAPGKEAKNALPPPPTNAMPPPPTLAANPPPTTTIPGGVNASASTNDPTKPPPPPPPPGDAKPPKKASAKKQQEDGLFGLDQDSLLMLGAGGMFVVAAAVILARMKKAKARRLAESQTQI